MYDVLVGLSLVVVASIGSVVWNLFAKRSRNKRVFLSLTISGSIVTMAVANLIGITTGLIEPSLPAGFFPVVIADAVLLVFSFSSLALAYQHGEMSVVYPVWRLFPLFVYVFGLLVLGESVTTLALLGIVVSVVGGYTIGLPDLRSFLQPLRSIRNPAFFYAVLAALGTTGSYLLQRSIVPQMSPFVYNVFLQGFAAPLMLTTTLLLVKNAKQELRTEWHENRLPIVMVALIGPITLVFTLYSLHFLAASLSATFSQIAIVLGALTGIVFLGERDRLGIKIASSLLIFAGIALIVFAR